MKATGHDDSNRYLGVPLVPVMATSAPHTTESVPPRTPQPLRVKELSPRSVAAFLADDPRLIVPIGGCHAVATMLPLGCDTLILEHLADDLSATFRVLRAPTLEYGVSAGSRRPLQGEGPIGGAVRKKTLHSDAE